MATISKAVLKKIISEIIANEEFETDKSGQIIIKTGIFEHNDGSFHDEPEKHSDLDEDDDESFLSSEEDIFDELDDDEEDEDEDE